MYCRKESEKVENAIRRGEERGGDGGDAEDGDNGHLYLLHVRSHSATTVRLHHHRLTDASCGLGKSLILNHI